MTDAPSALATVLISSSGSGSAHATRFATPGLPLNRVGESCGISASFASSAVSALPCSASATAFDGIVPDRGALLDQRRADLAHDLHHAGDRLQQFRERIVGSLAPLRASARRETASPAGRSARRRSSTSTPGRARCRPRSSGGCARSARCRPRSSRPGEIATAAAPDRAAGSRAGSRAPATPSFRRDPEATRETTCSSIENPGAFSQYATPGRCTGRCRKRGKRRKRSSNDPLHALVTDVAGRRPARR